MPHFRKKTVVVEAHQMPSAHHCKGDNGVDQEPFLRGLAQWCGGKVFRDYTNDTRFIVIPTLEGEMRAAPDDWIIKGVAGEFYPIKDKILRMTYDEVSDV